ncbi:hypothetical protein ATERTT37_002993 [Aspergillus terreus]
MTALNQSGDTQFTVFIRLPFPRGDFVDPAPVEWNAAKDQALWDILSRPSKGDDIDSTEAKEQKWASYGRRPSTGRREPAPAPHLHKSPTLEEEDLTSSPSESESDLEETTVSRRGPRFRHFGKFSTHRQGLRDDDEDDDESPAFLPVSRGPEHAPRESAGPDLNATLRMESEDPSAPRRRVEQNPIPRKSVTAESSTSSMQV